MESVSLTALADLHLTMAKSKSARSGRSAHVIRQTGMRMTLLALVAGHMLNDHTSPDGTTLQVLRGQVRLSTARDSWTGSAGDLLIVPHERHRLTAMDDAVIVLTVPVSRPATTAQS
jgi:quercetin dioxygenase-like cupin family protein